MFWTLPDVIDIPNLQRLMDRFHAATGIPVGIIGCDGTIHVATGWQDICTNFHRCHPTTAERCRQSDDYIKTRLSTENYVQYKCRNGLWDLAVPIIIAGEHVATLFLGQFFYEDEEIDEAFFLCQAHEFGFDPDRYMAALGNVPVFTREKVQRIMAFYTSFVDFLVSMGLSNHRRTETEKTLRESEEKFSKVFHTAPISMAISTVEGKFLEVNELFERHTGYTPDETIGHSALELGLWCDPTERQMMVSLLERDGEVRDLEFALRAKGGEHRVALFSGVLINLHSEKLLLSLVNDITERKRAEEALLQARNNLEKRVAERTEELANAIETMKNEIRERQRIEESLKAETAEKLQAMVNLREKEQLMMQQSRQAAMGEMIGNIAHQWRQPLNGLGLLIQDLKLCFEAGEMNQAYIDDLVDKSMGMICYMSQTIDDFRTFFRPDKEKVSFKALQVITKTLSLVEGGFKDQRIRIEVNATDDPTVHGYPNEYSQALLNILINTRDAFSSRKTDAPMVAVNLFTQDGRAVVTITDNAGGIPDEIMDKIFDPYFTTKGPDKGTGVGLFMSKTIIEKNMDGSLSVRNTPDGAEFRIEV